MTFGELDEDGTIMRWMKGLVMFSARSMKNYEA